jgi:hypothetical protein
MTDTPIPVIFIHGLWLHPLSWTEWAGACLDWLDKHSQ